MVNEDSSVSLLKKPAQVYYNKDILEGKSVTAIKDINRTGF